MRCFFIVLCAVLSLIPASASAYLSKNTETALTRNLEAISAGESNVAAFSATNIFSDPNYNTGDWEIFFNKFFTCSPSCAPNSMVEHYFTTPLYNYFVKTLIPDALADDHTTFSNLQTGLIGSLWSKISRITYAYPADLSSAMFNDALLRQNLFNSHRFFALLAEKGAVSINTRTLIYINYKNYIRSNPQYFSDATTIDNFEQPFVAFLRAQVWVGFAQALPLVGTRKGEFATTIGLGGAMPGKLDIWNAFAVLIVDNNGLDSARLNSIYNILSAIPVGLQNLKYVTVRDFITPSPTWRAILNKGKGNNYNLAISPENKIQFSFRNTRGEMEEFASQNSLPPDAWNHAAVIFNGTTVTIYLNGEQDVAYTARGLPNANSSKPLQLGMQVNKFLWMKGKMDEVKIYGRALTATEIIDEYNNQSVSTAKLVASFGMNEPSGAFVSDSSGLENNGTNVGATVIAGKASHGLFFNGKDSYVEVPDNPTLRLAGAMTLEAWLYIVNENEAIDWGGLTAVNISSWNIGGYIENQFPDDIAAISTDGFSIVAVHEINHIVDSFSINGNAKREYRRDQLIRQASSYKNDLQFLRMSGWKFFSENPQEFFAGTSNQYFTDSWHTFDLAIQRFNKGYKEPINQFLFFADVYSKGGLTTKFYTLNKKGDLTVKDVPIYRDFMGYITDITREDTNTVYHFILDFDGNVLLYRTSPATKQHAVNKP